MIQSFRSRATQDLFEGKLVVRYVNFKSVAERKLQMLHRSKTLSDLRVPPNNQLEALKGNRKGQYSIRINSQWRICFEWHNGEAWNVEIVDYHD
jgi:proteic killer suppression protein